MRLLFSESSEAKVVFNKFNLFQKLSEVLEKCVIGNSSSLEVVNLCLTLDFDSEYDTVAADSFLSCRNCGLITHFLLWRSLTNNSTHSYTIFHRIP